jgi:hypothetical protein
MTMSKMIIKQPEPPERHLNNDERAKCTLIFRQYVNFIPFRNPPFMYEKKF